MATKYTKTSHRIHGIPSLPPTSLDPGNVVSTTSTAPEVKALQASHKSGDTLRFI